jgi:Flp pilus assembly protein TadG
LPVLCLLLLGVVQVAVIVRDQLAVQLAAREAARAAAVAADADGAGTAAGQDAVRLRPLDVRIDRSSGVVTASAAFVDHTDVPLIGALLPDVRVTASATMQWEPP